MSEQIQNAYALARERYAELGVQTDEAMDRLSKISISLHCWQGDDVGGFERDGAELTGGGIQATGDTVDAEIAVGGVEFDLVVCQRRRCHGFLRPRLCCV